jgi:S-adenosylmethionine-diacylglycerol 3-amino-3-carboxypropyl transferase
VRVPRRRPLYAADNEDTRSELRALAPEADDAVVCVAAGGGRALSLLAAGARSFVAVDRRASQLHVLELKAAALDALSYPRLRRFVGLDPDDGRLDTWSSLRHSLSPAARRYWDARPTRIAAGAMYAGRLETWLGRCAALLRGCGALRWPAACFASRDLAEQRARLAVAAAAVRRGERGFAWLMHPAAVWVATQDPSFWRSDNGNPGRCLYGRFVAWARAHLLRESFLLHLIFFGRYDPAGALPVWLTPAGAEAARKHLVRLRLTCADLSELPGRMPEAAVHWSLSDVSCWMGERRFHDLLAAIAATSPPGSRVCFRNLAVRRSLPPEPPRGGPRLRRRPALAAALDRDDASVFYRFEVATVMGS